MEKELKRLIRILKAEYALMWVLTVLLAALYECDILPQGLFAGDAQMEYIMQVTSILLTICLIPLSLRLFNLSLTRYVSLERNPYRLAISACTHRFVRILLDDEHNRTAMCRHDRHSVLILHSKQATALKRTSTI